MDGEMSLWGMDEWDAAGYVYSLTAIPLSSASISDEIEQNVILWLL